MSDQIMKLLANSSAQNPMSFADLVATTGLLNSTLERVLDNLYATHQINQATVTRKGITQREVWRTGVVQKGDVPRLAINPNYTPPSGHLLKPARSEEIKAKPVDAIHLEKECLTMKSEDKKTTPPNVKSRVLELLGCSFELTSEQIKSHVDIGNYSVATLLKPEIARGQVLVEKRLHKNYYSLGKSNFAQQSGNAPREAFASDVLIEISSQKQPETISTIELDETVIANSETKPQLAIEKAKLKIAYTSNKTIILFGLTADPFVELSQDESADLIDFCAQMDMCCSVDVPAL